MALTQKVTIEIKNSSGETVASKVATISAASEHEFSVVAPGNGNVVVVLTAAFAAIKAFAVLSDKAVAMDINVPADQTINLAADTIADWHLGAATANPISHDIVSIKFRRTAAGDATIRGVFLVDA